MDKNNGDTNHHYINQQGRRIAVPVRSTPIAATARFTASSRLVPGHEHPSNGGGGDSRMINTSSYHHSPSSTGGGGYTIKRSYTPSSGISGGGMDYSVSTTSSLHHQMSTPTVMDYGFRGGKFPRNVEKSRGLRHFSHKVCEKVKEKGQTNYNEVADELVMEYFDSLVDPPSNTEKQQYDMKNIRRRVYDALNVLMAMNIIEKEKKEIRWVGLPTSSLAECRRLEEEKAQRQDRLRSKTEQLQELMIQLVAYKSLVRRNRSRERSEGRPAEAAVLYLPYIIVNTDRNTSVECRISGDKTEYHFNFDRPFEIHDDIEVLKRLGLAYGLDRAEVPVESVPHIKQCLPAALRDYVDQIIEGTLAGGVINKAGKGPHTVTISANQQDRKPLLKVGPSSSSYGQQQRGGPLGSYLGSPGQRPSPIPIARYAVIPRTVVGQQQGQQRYALPSHQQQQVIQRGQGATRVVGQYVAVQPQRYVGGAGGYATRSSTGTYVGGGQQGLYHQQEQEQQHYVEGEDIYDDEDENIDFV